MVTSKMPRGYDGFVEENPDPRRPVPKGEWVRYFWPAYLVVLFLSLAYLRSCV